MTLYKGTIWKFHSSPYWRGSPWEGAEIQWSDGSGLQIISMFETKGDVSVPGLPESLRELLVRRMEAVMEEPYASKYMKIGIIMM